MCGRITQQLSPDRIGGLYGVWATPLPPDRPPRYNGAPGQDFSACRLEQDGARTFVRLRWGLVPSWSRDARTGSRLINARAESVHFKPSFRAAFRLHRCLLPALLELAREPQDGPFERRAVSARVNRVRNDDPEVLLLALESGRY